MQASAQDIDDAQRVSLQLQPEREDKEAGIGSYTERGQHRDNIAACSEPLSVQPVLPHLREELLVPLLPSKQAGE